MKQAGRRDKLISLFRQSTTVDAYGSRSGNAWEQVTQMWAELLHRGQAGGTENLAAYQMYPQSKVVFIISHPDPFSEGSVNMIQHEDRIRWDGKEYTVEGMEEIGRKEGLRIYCIEKGDGIPG